MRHEIPTPPRTMMEVYQMLPEGTLAELIEGSLYMSPAPNRRHQEILRNLFVRIHQFVKENHAGETYFSPFDVFLDATSNAVQPDIIFVLKERLSIIKDDAIHGVPDLLIEVLSAGNSDHDLIRKKGLYEKFGVKEYWIVNPETKETIGYSLKGPIYIECGRFTAKIVSPLLQTEFVF